jgi:hypothetical protein
MNKKTIMVEENKIKTTKDPITSKIKELSIHVQKLRKSLIDVSEKDNVKAKNSFVFWYSPRTNDISCHLLGHHLVAENIKDLLDYTEIKICEIYNDLYLTNCISLDQLAYDDEPEKWDQERLIREYKQLQQKLIEKNSPKTRKPKRIKNETDKVEANT